MLRYLLSTSLVCSGVFASVTAFAYDADSSGVSDVYENLHGQVLPAAEDADADGYSNYLESLFGSDPLDPADPGNLNFSVFEQSNSKQNDRFAHDGKEDVLGLLSDVGRVARLMIPNQVGLRYRIESKEDLSAISWEGVGEYQISDGQVGEVEIDLSGVSAAFFRLGLAPPLNSDSDGLNDWEEGQLGTNPLLSDSDNDLLDDDIEAMIAGSDPLKVDSDGDGFVDKEEYESGSDPDDGAAWPPVITSNAWSAPVVVNNTLGPTEFFGEAWSSPVVVKNTLGPTEFLGESWSAPVVVQNTLGPTEFLGEAWSAPIVVQNTALAGPNISEIWSAPILVRNTYEPAP